MPPFADDPAFRLYALCSVILAIKMHALGAYTGRVRKRRGYLLNAEDAKTYQGRKVATTEHPEVERVLRAHRNDLENIPMFWALGLIAVLVQAPLLGLQISFIAFTVGRLVHSYAYVNELSPWRGYGYGLGLLAKLALMVMTLIRLF
jgi:prostaglandin-E synthase 1